jgi:hypothetical protein
VLFVEPDHEHRDGDGEREADVGPEEDVDDFEVKIYVRTREVRRRQLNGRNAYKGKGKRLLARSGKENARPGLTP